MNSQEKEFEKLLDQLNAAIEVKNKQQIIDCYTISKEFNFEKISESLLEEFDELVDRANLIV